MDATQRDHFRIAAEFAPTHIIFTDPEGVIRYANPAVESITGYSMNEIIGRRPNLWGGKMPKAFYQKLWKTIKRDRKPFHGEVTNRRKNGKTYFAELWVKPVIERGRLIGFVGIERDITDIKSAISALSEREERLRQITGSMEEGFFLIDASTLVLLDHTPGFDKAWGFTQTKRDVATAWFKRVLALDRLLVQKTIAMVREGKPMDIEFRVMPMAGQPVRWVQAHLFPVAQKPGLTPRVAGIVRDVTMERALVVEKAALARNMSLVLGSVQEGVISIDMSHRCVFANTAACELLGFDRNELKGKDLHRLLHRRHPDGSHFSRKECPIAIALKNLEAPITSQAEIFFKKNGTPLPVVYNFAPLVGQEGGGGAVISFLDASESQKMEEKARELEQLKNRFIQIVSHQFRTPLNAIRWNLEALSSEKLGNLTVEQKKFAQLILAMDVEVISRIGDLLIALDIEEGRVVVQKEEISLSSLVQTVHMEMLESCGQKEISCKMSSPRNKDILVNADPEKIRIAVQKLLDNARDYTKKGGTVTSKLTLLRNGIVARFEVTDTGVGVPKGESHRIFDRFFRGSNASSMKPDASGLGLYIAKHFIEAHGGEIGYTPGRKRGSTFWFELPVIG